MADHLQEMPEGAVEQAADAMRGHHIDLAQNDRAQDHDTCTCGVLVEDWDEHWARVALAAALPAIEQRVRTEAAQETDAAASVTEEPTRLALIGCAGFLVLVLVLVVVAAARLQVGV